ncbi:helix-turn-helix domain-containing protein [Mycobacteroides abscessus]|uniref:helix-turn-helix domain-containing protein n=1 Tax=Mycobacteroides abscessus TaxID=36809 RepID=UPI0009A6F054|nr:helix-turn-helix transcriptional regulator [Mycobacteroides abscessus]
MRLQSGDTLRALMRQRKFSMSRLGRYAGCSKTFIHGLCCGAKRSCSPGLAERIAEALDVPLALLFVAEASIDSKRNVQNRTLTARERSPHPGRGEGADKKGISFHVRP